MRNPFARSSLCLVALALAAAIAPSAQAQQEPWQGASIIDDPAWRNRFLGSYGFLSGAEPQVAQSELELLREVIELMKVNPQAAAAMLESQSGADGSAALDFVLANLHFQNGEQEKAIARYESALEKFPDFRRAHKNLGLLLVQRTRCKDALPHLSQAVELGDRDGRTYGLIGYCYIEAENYLPAESAYRNAILQEPDTRDWKLGLARALLAMERHREAASLFGALIEENPDDASAWLLQANAYLGLEQPLAAAVNLEAVRMMGKAQTSSLVLLGDIYMNEGMTALARDAYVEVIRADASATGFDTAYRAADLMLRTRAYGEAGELLGSIDARYEKLAPDDELKLLTLKARLARAQGRKQEAAQLLESVVARDGTRGDALLELAAYYREKGDDEHAVLLIERAQKLEAYEYQALLDHAQIRVTQKDYARAAELLREALRIRNEPRVERFLAQVEQARS